MLRFQSSCSALYVYTYITIMKANPAFGIDSEAFLTDLAVQGDCDETADEKSN